MINNEIIEYKRETLGSYINSYNIRNMQNLKIENATKIMFIENKANYIDYIYNKKAIDEFVVYHGGMYSPIKGEFFKKLYKAAGNIELYHWSDMDIGGFKIFTRLKEIIPSVQPYKMDKVAFYDKQGCWKKMEKEYMEKLIKMRSDSKYQIFHELIDEMLKNCSKLEQEAFL